MLRSLIIFTIITALSVPALGLMHTADIMLQSEYRRDALDFEECAEEYYRHRMRLYLSKKSMFTYTHVNNSDMSTRGYSWSLLLRDISPSFALLLGNFYAHFGYGLLIGKRSPFSPDIFSRGGHINTGNTFTPCNSGNSAYSFHGIAASYFYVLDNVDFALHAFYSIKNRYITGDSYDTGQMSTSLSGIDGRTKSESLYTEPADIHTGGGLASLLLRDTFRVQVFSTVNRLQTPSGETLLFNHRNEWGDDGTGTERIGGAGFNIRYSDPYVTIFMEKAATSRRVEGSRSETIKGAGILYGVKVGLPALKFSVIGKDIDPRYASLQMATIGENYPEKGWFSDALFTLHRDIRVGMSASSEKKRSTGTRDHEPNVIRREKLYLVYKHRRAVVFKADASSAEKLNGGERESKRRARASLTVTPFKALSLTLAHAHQICDTAESSHISSAGITLKPFRRMRASIVYAKAVVAEDNRIYTKLVPIRNSSLPGLFLDKDTRIIALRASLKFGGAFFSCRYFRRINAESSEGNILEFFGSVRF